MLLRIQWDDIWHKVLSTIPETEHDTINIQQQAQAGTEHQQVRGEGRGCSIMMVITKGGAGRGSRDRNQQWVFQGKVQGSVIFRQYYPEGGWGCVIVMVGVSIRASNEASTSVFTFKTL